MRHLLIFVLAASAFGQQPLTSPLQDYRHLGEFNLRTAKRFVPKVELLAPTDGVACLDPYSMVYSYAGGTLHICQPTTFAGTSGVWATVSSAAGGASEALIQSGAPLVCTGAGTAGAQTCDLTPELTEYTANQVIHFTPGTTNTTTQTINIDGLGAKSILRFDGSSLSAGDLTADRQYAIWYDGTDFRLPYSRMVIPHTDGSLTADIASGVDRLRVTPDVFVEVADLATTNAGTATALAANGANCSAGQAARGVSAAGAAEDCFAPTVTPDQSIAGFLAFYRWISAPNGTGATVTCTASAATISESYSVSQVSSATDCTITGGLVYHGTQKTLILCNTDGSAHDFTLPTPYVGWGTAGVVTVNANKCSTHDFYAVNPTFAAYPAGTFYAKNVDNQ